MSYLTDLTTKIARSEGDPKIISAGPSSLSTADRLGRALGWFSFGLGLAEIIAPRKITRALGMEGKEALVRAYGVREIGAGIFCLSIDKQIGLWNRVAGDGIDIATLSTGLRRDNPKRDNVMIALGVVLGVTALDVLAAQVTTSAHRRGKSEPRSYRDRTGYPKGIERSRGVAKEMAHAMAPKHLPKLSQDTVAQGSA